MCLRARGLEDLLQTRDGELNRALSLSTMLRNPDGSIKHRSVHEYLLATYGLEKIQGPTGFAAARRPTQKKPKKPKAPKAAAQDSVGAVSKTSKDKVAAEGAGEAGVSASTPHTAKQAKAGLKAQQAAVKAKEKEEARLARETAKQKRIAERDARLASVKAGIAARKRGHSPTADVLTNAKRRKLGKEAPDELEQLQREVVSLQAALVLNQTDDAGRRVGHFTFQATDDSGAQVKRTLVIRLSPADSASDGSRSTAQPSRAPSAAPDKSQPTISAMAEARKVREQNVWVKGAADQSDSDSDMSDVPERPDAPESLQADSPLSSAPPSSPAAHDARSASRASSRESSPASSRGFLGGNDGEAPSSSTSSSALLTSTQRPPLDPASPTLHPSFTLEASVSPARPPLLPAAYSGGTYSAPAGEHDTLAALQNLRSTQWGFADDAPSSLLDSALRSSSFPLRHAGPAGLADLPDDAVTLPYSHHPPASQDSDASASASSGAVFPRHPAATTPPLLHSAFRGAGGGAGPSPSISYPASPRAFLDDARAASSLAAAAAASASEGHSG